MSGPLRRGGTVVSATSSLPDRKSCLASGSFWAESYWMLTGLDTEHSALCQEDMARSSIGDPMAEKFGLCTGQSVGVGAKCIGTMIRFRHEHAPKLALNAIAPMSLCRSPGCGRRSSAVSRRCCRPGSAR